MTPDALSAALRDALAEARHGDPEPLRKTLRWMMVDPTSNVLAEAMRAEMRGSARAYLRSLWIHVVDADSRAYYDAAKASLERDHGALGELEWERE